MLTTKISKSLVGATLLFTTVALQSQQSIAAETLTVNLHPKLTRDLH